MVRRALGFVALGAGLVLMACGDDDEATSPYPSADSFCTAKADEECKAVASSCGVTDDACKTARKNACTGLAGGATGQGRTYDATKAQNCISKTTEIYRDRTIDATKEEALDEACERVFTGLKKKNEACSNAYDCEGTLICDVEKGSVCADKVLKKERDGCNNPGDVCDKGLYCKPEGPNRFCVPKAKVDEQCRIGETPCAEDLRCNGSFCVAKVAGGNPCDTNEECTTNFCDSDKRCRARQYASETGSCKDFGGN